MPFLHAIAMVAEKMFYSMIQLRLEREEERRRRRRQQQQRLRSLGLDNGAADAVVVGGNASGGGGGGISSSTLGRRLGEMSLQDDSFGVNGGGTGVVLVDPDVDEPVHFLFETLVKLVSKVSLGMLALSPPIEPLEFYSIHASEEFTMCIFVLKKGHKLPIHTHPGMTVVSKVVLGSLHAKTYSLLDDRSYSSSSPPLPPPTSSSPSTSPPEAKQQSIPSSSLHPSTSSVPARVWFDGIVGSEDSPMTIHPSHGPNMHSFHASEGDVVILDIIGPPYLEGDRPCDYYQEEEEEGYRAAAAAAAVNGVDEEGGEVRIARLRRVHDNSGGEGVQRIYRGQPVMSGDLEKVRSRKGEELKRWAEGVLELFNRMALNAAASMPTSSSSSPPSSSMSVSPTSTTAGSIIRGGVHGVGGNGVTKPSNSVRAVVS